MFDFFKKLFKKQEVIPVIPVIPVVQTIEEPQLKEETSMLTKDKIQKILQIPNSDEWFFLFEKYFNEYEINSVERMAEFLAQTCHESGNYKFLKENLNYSSSRLSAVFPKYFKDVDVHLYHRKPEKIANRVYANRMGNGNEDSGDGWRYRGRGVIQITGKNNYTSLAKYLDKPISHVVKYLETKEGALVSALWFWKEHQLNILADIENHQLVCKRINGGLNGIQDRINKYNKFKTILIG